MSNFSKQKRSDNKILLRAGVGRRDITTEEPGVRINDPLYAKALVLDHGETKLVIITMDVTAIGGRKISDGMLPDVGENFLPELRQRIQDELHIPGCNVMVNASHTHPSGRMLCDDAEQVERVYDAVSCAVQNMTPVKIGVGKGFEERITINRTVTLKNGQHWTLRHTNPSPRDEDIASYGPVDHEIGILRIDRLDGTPLAVVYNFATHLLMGDTYGSITANIPGYASKVIETALGHDAMAFFIQGAAGDVMDVHYKNFSQPRNIEMLGIMLGDSILTAYRKLEVQPAALDLVSATITVPRRTDIPEQVSFLQAEQQQLLSSLHGLTLNFETFLDLYQAETKIEPGMDEFNQHNIDKYLKNISAMEQLARIQDKIATLEKHQKLNEASGEQTIDMELQGIKIGNCVIISSPLELLTEIGLNIKKSSPYEYTFIAAYSNGYVHYGAPASYYDKGGYEVTECFIAPEWQQIFEDKVRGIINRL
ncbi:MAG: hypothetical protein L3J71_05675 [Victivallaceae bacterium]|nr:hypothetical protein [Victivallaceae bacterium]